VTIGPFIASHPLRLNSLFGVIDANGEETETGVPVAVAGTICERPAGLSAGREHGMRSVVAGCAAALAMLAGADASAAVRLEPRVIGQADGFVTDVAIARLDRNRRPDVAVAVERIAEPGGMQVARNRRLGFHVEPLVPGGQTPYRIAVGDLDGDGDADAAVANTISQDVTVFGNHGAGGFGVTATHPAPYLTRGIAIAELDGDGRPDVVTSANDDPDGFTSASLRLVGAAPLTVPAAEFFTPAETILAVDVEGDRRRDVVAVDQSGVVVSRRSASGLEPVRRLAAVEDGPFDLAAGDLDGDGLTDLATANLLGPRVAVLLRSRDGGFEPPSYIDVGAGSAQIAIADLDGDRRRDLVVTLLDEGQVAVLRGRRGGGFRAPQRFDAGPVPLALDAADMDLDGDVDLVVGDRDSQELRLLVNRG
jgi:FG-GAP-like repeat